MIQWITTFAVTHSVLIYGLIFVLNYAFGPWLAMASGILSRLGYLSFVAAYATFMLSDLCGDAIWYHIGRKYGLSAVDRFGRYFGINRIAVKKVQDLDHKYKYSVLFLSKITNAFGLAIAVLITAGMVRIPFWRYMIINLAGQFIWSGVLIGVGYWFSHLYLTVGNLLGRVSLIAGALIAAFLVFRLWIYFRGRLEDINS